MKCIKSVEFLLSCTLVFVVDFFVDSFADLIVNSKLVIFAGTFAFTLFYTDFVIFM